MGYADANMLAGESGRKTFKIQSNYDIKLFKAWCYASSNCNEGPNNCHHGKDVFLGCSLHVDDDNATG